jgi:hypothetical protein
LKFLLLNNDTQSKAAKKELSLSKDGNNNFPIQQQFQQIKINSVSKDKINSVNSPSSITTNSHNNSAVPFNKIFSYSNSNTGLLQHISSNTNNTLASNSNNTHFNTNSNTNNTNSSIFNISNKAVSKKSDDIKNSPSVVFVNTQNKEGKNGSKYKLVYSKLK